MITSQNNILRRLFPFHLIINRDLDITSAGPSISKITVGICGKKFADAFTIIRPDLKVSDFRDLETLVGQTAIARYNDNKRLALKGQFELADEGESYLFACSPVVGSLKEIDDLGLNEDDFAAYDSAFNIIKTSEIPEFDSARGNLRTENKSSSVVGDNLQDNSDEEQHEIVKRIEGNIQSADSSLLRVLIDNYNNAVLFEDEKGRVAMANRSYYNMFGLDEATDNIIGRQNKDILYSLSGLYKDEAAYLARIQQLGELDIPVVGNELEMQDGRWMAFDYIPARFGEQRVGVLWVCYDVTYQKSLDSRINWQRQFYENILNALPFDIVVFDAKHRYLFVNPAAIANPWQREWMIGKTESDFCEQQNMPKYKEEQSRELFNSVVASKELLVWEEEFVRGEQKTYSLRYAYPVVDENDKVTMVISYGHDITERKKAERDIAEALEKQKELNELKSRFVSMISHEFRTPLSAILSSVQLVEKYWNTMSEEKRSVHFNRIASSITRMTELLNDVLFIGRTDAKKVAFSPKPINFKLLINDIVSELVIDNSLNRIKTVYDGDFLNISADEKLLRHILSNLLSNALKYSDSEKQALLTCFDKDEKIELWVQDQGIGIPEQDIQHLFDAFHRAGNVGVIQGTGLGLTIVKRSVRLHQGEISVESEAGKGTIFKVILPSGRYSK